MNDTAIGEQRPKGRFFIGALEVKLCHHCGVTQEVGAFYKNAGQSTGIQPRCISCLTTGGKKGNRGLDDIIDARTRNAIFALHKKGFGTRELARIFLTNKQSIAKLLAS